MRMRKFKQILIAICCLHGVVSSTQLLHAYGNTWYGYVTADGTPKRVVPMEQVVGLVLGATVLVLSCALYVRNRWVTSILIVATVGLLVHSVRAGDGGGVFDDSGVFAAIGIVLTFIWYVPQVAMLLLVLALTWRDPSRLKELVRSIRITNPGLRSVGADSSRQPDNGNQQGGKKRDINGHESGGGDGVA